MADQTGARIRVGCQKEKDVPKKRLVVVGTFFCTLELEIISMMALECGMYVDVDERNRWEAMDRETRDQWEREQS